MNITTVIIAHNEINNVQLCVQSLRLFAPDTSIIVIDNHSSDGLSAWLAEQPDLSYASCPDKLESYASLMNQVLTSFNVDEFILFLNPAYLVSYHFLTNLSGCLEQNESIALIGGIDSSFLADLSDSNYEEVVQYSMQHAEDVNCHPVIGLHFHALLLRYSILQQVGAFNEELSGGNAVWFDYQLRLHQKGFQIFQCPSARFFSLNSPNHWLADTDADSFYLEKKYGMHYFNFTPNPNLTDLICSPSDAEIHVLEVGCDCGATLLQIKNFYPNAVTYGLELNASAAAVASHFVDRVICQNIENQALDLPAHSLDYIIFGDVLEHLHNPAAVLVYLHHFLKQDGCIIASIPNLMHISVMESLLHGDFTYMENGLLDKTHIHFFTYNEILRLFSSTGFEIEDFRNIILPLTENQTNLIPQLLRLSPAAQSFMYESFQYLLRAKKKP